LRKDSGAKVSLVLYNTLTREKETFVPLDPSNVRMYVCGPTVYDFAHVGNARPVVVFDVLFRLLRRIYGERHVTYVRNITDVDDKIIAAARENKEPIDALTARTTKAFHADMAELGALPPSHEPRATQHIARMIAMAERLIESGHAYVADGHVLFHVPSMPDYGRLSRRSQDEMIAGARVEVAPYKKDPADFVLWKPSDADQPGWDSPWGRGRPGWHLECSVMSEATLGETFDIHAGGLDLIFPHHENEIAQSQCAHGGKQFVRYWLHNGYVTVNGEKMSKSLGNFFTVRQLLEEGHRGEAIRLVLLSAQYRQPLDFSREALKAARHTLDRLYIALRESAAVPADPNATVPEAIHEALCDDLNTPHALSHLHETATALNKAARVTEMARLKGELVAGGAVLGLLGNEPAAWLKGIRVAVGVAAGRAEARGVGVVAVDERWIAERIAAREAARKARNFAEADRIRAELEAKGVVLEDRPGGRTEWRRAG
jgi:cysteinyl-tRNA synthetase